MELSKRKYKKKEVEKLLNDITNDFTQKHNESLAEIRELTNLNKQLELKLEEYRNKELEISKAMQSAEKYADEVKAKIQTEYALTIEGLKSFSRNWAQFIEDIKKRYPLYSSINETEKIKEKLDKIINGESAFKEKIESIDKQIISGEKADSFDPQSMIKKYVASTSDTGFNLEEVLHPGNLELEDLCKELGLIEENG